MKDETPDTPAPPMAGNLWATLPVNPTDSKGLFRPPTVANAQIRGYSVQLRSRVGADNPLVMGV